MIRPELWGSLRQKYEEDRPRRMLSLDGGGIRGLITLGILESMRKCSEKQPAQARTFD